MVRTLSKACKSALWGRAIIITLGCTGSSETESPEEDNCTTAVVAAMRIAEE